MVTNWVLYKEKLFILHFHRQEIRTQDVNPSKPLQPARSFITSLSLTSPRYSLSWNNSYFSLVFIFIFCGSFVTVSVSGECLVFYEHGIYLPFISSVISSYVNKFVEKMSPFSNKPLKGSTGNYDKAYQ